MSAATPVIYSTVYTTRYFTVYAIISRFWARLPDGTRVLKHVETRYVTPEEYVVLTSEEKALRDRVQVPVEESEVSTAVGVYG